MSEIKNPVMMNGWNLTESLEVYQPKPKKTSGAPKKTSKQERIELHQKLGEAVSRGALNEVLDLIEQGAEMSLPYPRFNLDLITMCFGNYNKDIFALLMEQV